MNTIFTKTFTREGSAVEFRFEQVIYSNVDILYHITFKDGAENFEFRMYKDDEGQWKLAAQVLPIWIHENELKFNDDINESIYNL